MKLVLIDADGLAFHALRETLNESLEVLGAKVNNIFDKTQATHYSMFLSGGKYFRHDLFEGYKKMRERQKDRVSWKNTLKAILKEKYGAVKMYNVEADDLVSFMYYNYPETSPIIASPDKDLLFNIPGMHFNYSYKLQNKEDPSSVIEGWWVNTTVDEAKENFWTSMIVGDSTDGVIGLHGKGAKYAQKLFEGHPYINTDVYRNLVFNEYILYHGESKGIYEFQKTYRTLSLLSSPEDFEREVGIKEPELRGFCNDSVVQIVGNEVSIGGVNINEL